MRQEARQRALADQCHLRECGMCQNTDTGTTAISTPQAQLRALADQCQPRECDFDKTQNTGMHEGDINKMKLPPTNAKPPHAASAVQGCFTLQPPHNPSPKHPFSHRCTSMRIPMPLNKVPTAHSQPRESFAADQSASSFCGKSIAYPLPRGLRQ